MTGITRQARSKNTRGKKRIATRKAKQEKFKKKAEEELKHLQSRAKKDTTATVPTSTTVHESVSVNNVTGVVTNSEDTFDKSSTFQEPQEPEGLQVSGTIDAIDVSDFIP